jgi:hypothetical protein
LEEVLRVVGKEFEAAAAFAVAGKRVSVAVAVEAAGEVVEEVRSAVVEVARSPEVVLQFRASWRKVGELVGAEIVGREMVSQGERWSCRSRTSGRWLSTQRIGRGSICRTCI